MAGPVRKKTGISTYTNANGMVNAWRGYPEGTSFNQVPIAEILDNLLYPAILPTLTNPSLSFIISNFGAQAINSHAALLEVGRTEVLSFLIEFNHGSIYPNFGGSGFRAGNPTNFETNIPNFTNIPLTPPDVTASPIIAAHTVTQGLQDFTAKVFYLEGEQPLDSQGNNYKTPYPAGSIGFITAQIEGVYPLFATQQAINTENKLPLISKINATEIVINLAAETNTNKQSFSIPANWINGTKPISSIEFFNPISQQYDPTNKLSSFTQTSVNKTINAASIPYYQYKNNTPNRGALTIKIKF